MTLMTRWFGKKVNGDILKNLVDALEQDSKTLLQAPAGSRWSTKKTHGRVRYTPTAEGVKVDLYVFREDFHIKDGSVPADRDNAPSLYGNQILAYSDVDKKVLTHNYDHHIQGEIKYPIKENKVKQGTSTGEGVSI